MSLEEEASAISYGINSAMQKLEKFLEDSEKEEFTILELKDFIEKVKNNEI